MSRRDKRYEAIKPMYNEGKFEILQDIFEYMPRTVVARDIGKRGPRFALLIGRPEKFTIEELMLIAAKMDLSLDEILGLVKKQIEQRQRKGKNQDSNG